jgi:hypothetical protein
VIHRRPSVLQLFHRGTISSIVQFRKVIRKVIRRDEGAVRIAADVNAVVSGNIGGGSSHTHVWSHQTARSGGGSNHDQSKGG